MNTHSEAECKITHFLMNKVHKTISNPESITNSSLRLPLSFSSSPNSYLSWEMIIKMTLYKSGYYTPFKTGPGTHKQIPPGQVLVSIQVWCWMHSIYRQRVSTFTTVHIQDQFNLSKGTDRFPLALSYGWKKKCTKKTLIASLDKCRRQ